MVELDVETRDCQKEGKYERRNKRSREKENEVWKRGRQREIYLSLANMRGSPITVETYDCLRKMNVSKGTHGC